MIPPRTARTGTITRKTKETDITVTVVLDGTGASSVDTGIGFLDHLLATLAKHSRFDLTLRCVGDLQIDDHHTAEDCSIALGEAIDQALGERTQIERYGSAYAPLDEALSRAVVDLARRPWPEVDLGLRREMLGALATENITHVINTLTIAMRATIHVDTLRGDNDHHRAESAFKALALALRQACTKNAAIDIASTKGVL